MKKKDFDTVVFDLDGTLLDTLEDLTDAVNSVLEKYGFPKRSLTEVRSFIGNGARKLMERATPPDAEMKDEYLSEFTSFYGKNCDIKTSPYSGIPDLLRSLRSRGIKTGIISNKPDGAVKSLSEKYFGDLISVASGQQNGVPTKPAPDGLFSVISALGSTAEKTVYVGDSSVDAKTATAADVRCILVTWGFCDSVPELGFPYVNTAAELLSLLS